MNMPDDVFVREVNEELQRDELLTLWQRYGKPVLWGIIAILLAWAGYLYWQYRQNLAYGLDGEKFSDVVGSLTKNSDPAAESKLKELIKADAIGFHGPAGMIMGGLALQKDDAKKAATAFGGVATNGNAAQAWRDLALIRQTAAEFDTIKPEVVVSRLKGLAVKGNPWFGSAGEMTAIALMRQQKSKEAGQMFASISKDEKVPETIRNRSIEMANALGVEATALPAKEGTQ